VRQEAWIGFSESETPSSAVVPPDQKDFSGCRLLAFFFNGGGGVCGFSNIRSLIKRVDFFSQHD
jgi:hypothetical protein